jgi:hypothetical protein
MFRFPSVVVAAGAGPPIAVDAAALGDAALADVAASAGALLDASVGSAAHETICRNENKLIVITAIRYISRRIVRTRAKQNSFFATLKHVHTGASRALSQIFIAIERT